MGEKLDILVVSVDDTQSASPVFIFHIVITIPIIHTIYDGHGVPCLCHLVLVADVIFATVSILLLLIITIKFDSHGWLELPTFATLLLLLLLLMLLLLLLLLLLQ